MANLSDYYCLKQNSPLYFKFAWFLIYLFLSALTIFLINHLAEDFLQNPTITSLESTYYPVSTIPFPGVAICNINKISKKRTINFVKHLANLTKLDPDLLLGYARYLGNLIDFDFNAKDQHDILTFQSLLDDHNINIHALIRDVTTPCNELLIKCRWKGEIVNCSEIFELRLTYEGYCCTFNYRKITWEKAKGANKSDKEPLRAYHLVERGLKVIVQNNLEDYMYTTISSIGVKTQIFNPTDFPDKLSGDLFDVVMPPDSENFIEIEPTTIYSVPDVINYPVENRVCLFDSERPTNFEGVYSQSDCNVDCRVQSMLDLCNCIPFMIPLSNENNVCTLADLACLNAYKSKWLSIVPVGGDTSGLSKEIQDALRCDHLCYPACGGTLYELTSNSIIFESVSNATAINVYFPYRFSELYKQDVVYYWFEMLSNFGGAFGLLVGLSLISLVEIFIAVIQVIFRVEVNLPNNDGND